MNKTILTLTALTSLTIASYAAQPLYTNAQATQLINAIQQSKNLPLVRSGVIYNAANDTYNWIGPVKGRPMSAPRADFENDVAEEAAREGIGPAEAPVKVEVKVKAHTDTDRLDAEYILRDLKNPGLGGGDEVGSLTRQGLKIADRALRVQAEQKWLRDFAAEEDREKRAAAAALAAQQAEIVRQDEANKLAELDRQAEQQKQAAVLKEQQRQAQEAVAQKQATQDEANRLAELDRQAEQQKQDAALEEQQRQAQEVVEQKEAALRQSQQAQAAAREAHRLQQQRDELKREAAVLAEIKAGNFKANSGEAPFEFGYRLGRAICDDLGGRKTLTPEELGSLINPYGHLDNKDGDMGAGIGQALTDEGVTTQQQ